MRGDIFYLKTNSLIEVKVIEVTVLVFEESSRNITNITFRDNRSRIICSRSLDNFYKLFQSAEDLFMNELKKAQKELYPSCNSSNHVDQLQSLAQHEKQEI